MASTTSVGSVNGLLTKTGIGGLASGMELDTLVEKMTALQRQRITKQEQAVQKLLWKQDAYRTVSKALTEFKSKYFDILSSTNFKNPNLYNTVSATLPDSVKAFTATALTGSTAGKVYVNKIESLASAWKYETKSTVSKNLTAADAFSYSDLKTRIGGEANPNYGLTSGAPNWNTDPRFADTTKEWVAGSSNSIVLTLDGIQRAISLTGSRDATGPDGYAADSFLGKVEQYRIGHGLTNNDADSNTAFKAVLQDEVDRQFGASRINVDFDSTGRLEFSALHDSSKLTLNGTGSGASNSITALGFDVSQEGSSNRIALTDTLESLAGRLNIDLGTPSNADGNYTFQINGENFAINKGRSLNDLINMVNGNSDARVTLSYSELTDRFTLTSKDLGANPVGAVGDTTTGGPGTETGGNLLRALGIAGDTNTNYTAGTNAVLYINGQRLERSTNTFTVDKITYTLNDVYDPTTAPGYVTPSDPTKDGAMITLAPNTDALFDTVKKFVEDYNTMIDFMKNLTKEKTNSDYEPLTDDQKAGMTESQIKQWEDKAKSGILQNDSIVNNIATALQNAFSGTVLPNGFGLWDMGISTGDWRDNGKLTIDENKLRDTLSKRADDVKDLFTREATRSVGGEQKTDYSNRSTGISLKIDKILDDAIRTSGVSGTRGSLIEKAGYASTRSDKDNSLTTQIDNYLKRIDDFKTRLEREESRLWARFTAMETALSKLNDQNSILSQYLGNTQKSS